MSPKKLSNADTSTVRLYSIFDKKSKKYAMPFQADSDGVAVRIVTAAAMDPKSNLYVFPEDFELVYLGALGEQSGNLYSEKLLLAQVSTLKKKAQ